MKKMMVFVVIALGVLMTGQLFADDTARGAVNFNGNGVLSTGGSGGAVINGSGTVTTGGSGLLFVPQGQATQVSGYGRKTNMTIGNQRGTLYMGNGIVTTSGTSTKSWAVGRGCFRGQGTGSATIRGQGRYRVR
ncbi:MAG: hypothetical protein RDV48_29275 [Candidatus Eremiobacteraeota bacterium]|nr:hypothetical protein [Candidatus Eremiobacteraeota bacterium]